MRLFLHPHRAEVLAACALVMRQSQPLPDGLERLAADDVLLQSWVKRLTPALRMGGSLPETLHSAGLVTKHECAALAAEQDLPQALDRFSTSILTAHRWTWLIRHFPLALTLAMVLPALLISILFGESLGRIAENYAHLGMVPSWATILGSHPWMMALAAAPVIAAMAGSEWLIRSLRGVRHIAVLWCPEVERQYALLHLIQAARRQECSPLPLRGARHLLARLRIGSFRTGSPPWDIHWRTWMFLTRFRLDRAQRRLSIAQPDLTARLVTLGLVEMDDGRPDWELTESYCHARLLTAEAEILMLMRPALLWCGIISAVSLYVAPLFTLIYELGRQT